MFHSQYKSIVNLSNFTIETFDDFLQAEQKRSGFAGHI